MKPVFKRLMITLLAATFLATGCAHKAAEKRLGEKLDQESVKRRADLTAETTNLINSSSDLTGEQKTKLLELRDSVRTQSDALMNQSLKLRSVLVKDLISQNYNKAEVELIKRKIRATENQRVTVLFDAVEKANNILGRKAASNQKVMREFFEMHGARAD